MISSGFVEVVFIGLWVLSIVVGDAMDKGKIPPHTELVTRFDVTR